MCLRTWAPLRPLPHPRNNGITDPAAARTNDNGVRNSIYQIPTWSRYDVLAQIPIRTSGPERGRQRVCCSFSWRRPCLQLSSPPAPLLVASVTVITLPWHLSALPSCLTVPSPSLWGGTVCFVEVCLWGEGIPRCFRPPPAFQLITQNMTALLLFGAEMSCFSRSPRGVKIFCLVLSFLNFISRQRINTACESRRYVLRTGYTSVVQYFLLWCGLRLSANANSERNECFIKCRDV